MNNLPKPLQEPMDKLLSYKERTGLQSSLAKRMSTGVYGKMGEERQDTFGPYFNPVYFAEISTQVRLQVATFLYQHGIGPRDSEHLLHISVDGCLLDAPVSLVAQSKGIKCNCNLCKSEAKQLRGSKNA